MKRALIAMSGGVDSSLAAKMTIDAGYSCVGCTMKLYDNEDIGKTREHTCCSLDDIEDAKSVARELGIPHYVFNFKDGFKEKVIDKFIDAYECGKTPNPCIDCNRFMKFDKLFERAAILECDYIVTGHYARIEFDGKYYRLKKALDDSKDQSYVLYFLSQEQLCHILLPLGSLKKTVVRDLAEKSNFVNARKPDSQDICFVPDGDYSTFLKRYTGKQYPSGYFIDTENAVIGAHNGIINYTVGQRKGLGISFGKPMYVKSINASDNSITLCENKDLFSTEFTVSDVNWIDGEVHTESFRCKAKIRYRHSEQPATVIPLSDNKIRVIFDSPQRAITPGQSAVLYDNDTVLGGGIIEYLI